MLRVYASREIYAQGLTSVRYFISLLLVVSLVFGLMTLLLLGRLILSRLTRLSASVSSIGTSGDLSARLAVTGDDELSSLAQTINGMLVALEQSQGELREVEHRFRDVATTAGDWIWEVDAEGRYVYASPMVEQVLGYTPEEVVGRPYYDFFHPDEWEELRTLIQGAFYRRESFIKLISSNVHKDGREVIMETSGLPLVDADGELLGYRGAHRDVTAERRLRGRLAAVHTLGRELVLTRDEQEVAQAAVDAARLLLGCHLCELWLIDWEQENLVRRAVWAAEPVADADLLPLDSKQGITVAVARRGRGMYLPNVQENPRYIDAGIGSRSELCVPLKVEERVIGVLNAESQRVNGFSPEERQLILTLADQTSTAVENARLYQAVTTQRERLRALTTRLAETEEVERQQLARELHDRVGQHLTALGINLNIVRAQMPEETTEAVRERLDDTLALVKQTTQRIRDVMADLQPPVLSDYGLVAALRWYGAQFASRTGIDVTVAGEESALQLSASVENGLFRIAQEALTNAAKHAQATQVTMTVETDGDITRMTVADDGVGFDPAQAGGPDSLQGWGLLTMAERAEAMSGHFRIESSPHGGTQVVVEVEG
jgi:PAS domain S-box-containing protein